MKRALGVLLFSVALLACTTNEASDGAPRREDLPACTDGATRCDGDAIATCVGGVFGAPEPCDGESVCREDACRAPTPEQLKQASELASMLGYIEAETAWHAPLDWEKLRADGRNRILGGDGSERTYVDALFRAFIAVPQGHQAFSLQKGCSRLIPFASYSQRGACGQPHSRGIVVTSVKPNSPLGLRKGDLVTRVGAASGAGVLALLAERPMCGGSRPSSANRDAVAATTFADLLEASDTVEVESVDGTKRTVTVPAGPLPSNARDALACADPFARALVPVESEIRADGVGVIRLPGFTDPEQKWPTNPTEDSLAAYQAAFEAKILAAFEKVKTAPAIVWDVRGNGGGLTAVGLTIAAGFPGARSTALSYCEARIPKSTPPTFDTSFRYAEYALTPGGPFAYDGKVAVLVDGLDYSAADYFPLAVKARTSATLVGATTAGAFGATSNSKTFAGPPEFNIAVDANRCSSAEDGTPLEGKGVTPHIAAEYDPKDVAAGRDTVLERAIQSLK